MDGGKLFNLRGVCLAVVGLLLWVSHGSAADYSFTNSLARAALAEKRGDVPSALRTYEAAQDAESNHVANLCALARKYCGLTFATNLAAMGVSPKDLVQRALACSLRAVALDPNSAAAHACAAVAYAKSCAFADLKTELRYSRRFKLEAERTIALDPSQDIAYYLLGQWNYNIANVGLWSRAFVKVVYGGLPPASNAEAIAYFKKAIQLAPGRIIHHAGLAMAYAAAGEKQLEIAELKICRALKPSSPEDVDPQRDAVKKLAALGQ